VSWGVLVQLTTVAVYCVAILFCAPALWRLLTVVKPPWPFDAIKGSLALLAVTMCNSVIVRTGYYGATLLDDAPLARVLATGLVAAAFSGLFAAVFLTERAMRRVTPREP